MIVAIPLWVVLRQTYSEYRIYIELERRHSPMGSSPTVLWKRKTEGIHRGVAIPLWVVLRRFYAIIYFSDDETKSPFPYG